MSQALHVSVQVSLQQTPSTQCWEAHSDDCAHDDPLLLGPQDWPAQLFGAWHCAFELQESKQAVLPLQAYGAQARGVDGRHWPWPSHVGAGVTVPPLQLAVPHAVPAGFDWQGPPSLVGTSGAASGTSACPSSTTASRMTSRAASSASATPASDDASACVR
jgi:hypothetical protein